MSVSATSNDEADKTDTQSNSPLLVIAGVVFAAVVIFHNSDHARRGGDSVSSDVLAVGTTAILLELIVIALTVGRHRLGPLFAVAAGFSLAAGYLLVHFTPRRTWLSDSLIGGSADTVTIAAGVLETISALVLGIAGLRALRLAGGLAATAVRAWSAEWSGFLVTLKHPVVVAFAICNAVGLAVTYTIR
jgi:hypothetical protein